MDEQSGAVEIVERDLSVKPGPGRPAAYKRSEAPDGLSAKTDMLLMIPMTYAAITGILSYRRMVFANRVHRIALTASLVYITASVPLHLYVAFVLGDVSFYVHMAGYWFSYFLLLIVYPAFLTLFAKLQYRN